ncbi:MAG: RpiB/LacA/LacB family sugar-phosphate isomerase [Anaerolineae bacterium]|jgi:ribose 5-phosphate isomerase B
MRIGIAADHGGFELKERLAQELREEGHEVVDFGAHSLTPGDDYPDYVAPLARAVAQGKVERGIAICGSGVGACVAANKIPGVRACLVHEIFSAHQGVEDDNMNVICLGGRVVSYELAWDLVQAYLSAKYQDKERFRRRLDKVTALEQER